MPNNRRGSDCQQNVELNSNGPPMPMIDSFSTKAVNYQGKAWIAPRLNFIRREIYPCDQLSNDTCSKLVLEFWLPKKCDPSFTFLPNRNAQYDALFEHWFYGM